RHFEYGKICDSLDIVVMGNTKPRETEREKTRNRCVATNPFVEGGERNNVRIYPSGGGNKMMRFFKACKLAGKIMRNKKMDLITTQDTAFTGLIGYCLKKKFKTKLNIQIHGREEKLLNKILFFSIKGSIIKSADSIRVVSERIKKWVVDKYKVNEKKIFKIPICAQCDTNMRMHANDTNNTNNTNNTNGKSDSHRDYFTILTVGRLVKVKNIKLQIEALVDVLKIFPKTELIIVGDGPERKSLEKLAGKLKIKKNVKFEGWQNELTDYYKKADLFVLTSDKEGWSMAVIESMLSGCPVVMTEVGCAGEVVKNEQNGLVIPVNNKKALISAISKMIADKDKRKKFAVNGMETIAGLPDKEKTLRMYKGMWGEN
ncbi:glycosyltransferase family 4 protein, partial [Patescibacteria group bacterium]